MQLLSAEQGIGVTTFIFHAVLALLFKNLIYTMMMQEGGVGIEYLVQSLVGRGALENYKTPVSERSAEST